MITIDRLARSFEARSREALSRYYYGNRYPWQRAIRQARFRRAREELARCEPELYAPMREMLTLMGRDPDRPSSRHSDALFLLEEIVRRRPRRVLECGAGLSTLIFAYALEKLAREGHEAELVSLEESAEYLDRLVSPAIAPDLRRRARLIVSPIAYWRYDNRRTGRARSGIGFVSVPPLDYDFVYVDGPQVRQGQFVGTERVDRKPDLPPFLTRKPFDCDALNVLIDRRRPMTVVIDQRIDTRWQMMDLLDPPMSVRYAYGPRKSVFELRPENAASLTRSRLDTGVN